MASGPGDDDPTPVVTPDPNATQPETAADGAAPGATIGRFEIERQIGAGGMGLVFAARDPMLARRIALKLIHPEAAGTGGEARLLREAQALARLTDPNVVTVHE